MNSNGGGGIVKTSSEPEGGEESGNRQRNPLRSCKRVGLTLKGLKNCPWLKALLRKIRHHQQQLLGRPTLVGKA